MNGNLLVPDPEEAQYFKVLEFNEQQFTITWFYRAFAFYQKVPSDNRYFSLRTIDVADRFISLWICFNSILRSLYGEDKRDDELLDKCKKDTKWQAYFEYMNDHEFREHLTKLKTLLPVKNMKNNKLINLSSEDFKSLISVIYQIRNNLFHGRKRPDDTDTDDYELIRLAYFLLAPLIIEYVRDNDLIATYVHPEFEIKGLENGIDFTG